MRRRTAIFLIGSMLLMMTACSQNSAGPINDKNTTDVIEETAPEETEEPEEAPEEAEETEEVSEETEEPEEAPEKKPKYDKNKIREMYNKGKRPRQIAEELGYPLGTVAYHVHKIEKELGIA